MGANTISQKLKINLNEAAQLITSFLSKFPGIKQCRDSIISFSFSSFSYLFIYSFIFPIKYIFLFWFIILLNYFLLLN